MYFILKAYMFCEVLVGKSFKIRRGIKFLRLNTLTLQNYSRVKLKSSQREVVCLYDV